MVVKEDANQEELRIDELGVDTPKVEKNVSEPLEKAPMEEPDEETKSDRVDDPKTPEEASADQEYNLSSVA